MPADREKGTSVTVRFSRKEAEGIAYWAERHSHLETCGAINATVRRALDGPERSSSEPGVEGFQSEPRSLPEVGVEKVQSIDQLVARFADVSPGDVISAEFDGTIFLDDGITTWNPERASRFLVAGAEKDLRKTVDALASEFERRSKEAHDRGPENVAQQARYNAIWSSYRDAAYELRTKFDVPFTEDPSS